MRVNLIHFKLVFFIKNVQKINTLKKKLFTRTVQVNCTVYCFKWIALFIEMLMNEKQPGTASRKSHAKRELSWAPSRGICFPENGFRETTFQTFLCLFVIRKVGQRKTLSGQRKTLSNQRKIWFGFQESVFLLFWTENTFWKLWKS